MDVALDANEFLSDPRMESVRLQSLLNYLRKTDSRLIIPKIVWDEVIARYPERISGPHKKAVDHAEALRRLLLSGKVPRMPDLKHEREIKALKQKLKKPSNHVRSRIIKNFTDVVVEEVARRGVSRIAPANSKGEELRDVIIWLMMVAYAKRSTRDVAFISHDEHFREGDALHPELKKDLEQGKVKLHFYRSIDDFIKTHAPAPDALSEDEAFGLLGRQYVLDLFEIEARRFIPRQYDSGAINVVDRSVSFARGALYDVGGGARYGEIEFSGQMKLEVERSEYLPGSYVGVTNTSQFEFDAESGFTKIKVGAPLGFQTDLGNYAGDLTTTYVPQANIAFDRVIGNVSHVLPPLLVTRTRTSESFVSGKLEISVRVVSGKLTKVEVERFELTERRELAVTTAAELKS
jgi:predicted nucleic acid-binding protein